MKSNNPIFNRSEQFNGTARGNQAYAGQAYPGYGQTTTAPEYGDPSQMGTGAPGQQADQGRMTIDTVVQKTAITLFVVIAAAALTWFWTGDSVTENAAGQAVTDPDAANKLYLALMIGSFGAFALSLVNSFKKVISPALVIAFAALEGVALGAYSARSSPCWPASTSTSSCRQSSARSRPSRARSRPTSSSTSRSATSSAPSSSPPCSAWWRSG